MPLRHSRFAWLALGICFASCAVSDSVRGEQLSAVDLKQSREVERLIRQLDSDKPSERIQARDALLALGPKILPLLPQDRAITSAAARQALHEIRLRLQREAAIASLAPSTVTLKGKYSLQHVLAQIASQTGNEFDTHALDHRVLERTVTVDFRSRTYWSACDEVVSAAGLSYGSAPGKRLEIIDVKQGAEQHPLAVTDAGAFRVAIASANIRPPVVSRSGYVLRIGWSLRAEPRLRPLFAAIAGSDLHVQTRERQLPSGGAPSTAAESVVTEFRPISPTAKLELSMSEGQDPLRLDTDFEFPAGRTWTPKIDFSGSLAVEMAAGPVQFVFDELAVSESPSQRAGCVVVRVRSVEFPTSGKSGDGRVEISVVYDQSGPAFESYRTWMYHNEVWLETKDGRRLRPRPLVATRQQDDGGVAVEYNFADVTGTPADYRLVYVAPTLITSSPVQFQLRNLPTTRAEHPGGQP